MTISKQLLLFVIAISLLLGGCSSLTLDTDRQNEYALTSGQASRLANVFAGSVADHAGQSGFLLLNTGKEAFLSRLALLDLAEKAVDIQYYIWNSDISGRLVAQRMLMAAERGVRVRLLLDDFNVGGRDIPLMALDAHPNISIRIYNPNASRQGMQRFFGLVGDFGRLNQRMHNKSFIVDASAAIIGGRNIGDEYFDLDRERNFRDRDLLAVGPVVSEISTSFDAYWNSERAFSIREIIDEETDGSELADLRESLENNNDHEKYMPYAVPTGHDKSRAYIKDVLPDFIWATGRVIFDDPPGFDERPDGNKQRVASALKELAEKTENEIIVESAYLILGDEGLDLLSRKRGEGIKVAALTNSLASNDLVSNHSGYVRRRTDMLEHGMSLYELKPDAESCQELIEHLACDNGVLFALHAKSIVFDRKHVFVGSFNLNLRSVFFNSETALIVDSPELASRIADDIQENMKPENAWHLVLDEDGRIRWTDGEDARDIRSTLEPSDGFWRRFFSDFLSLWPIEKYL